MIPCLFLDNPTAHLPSGPAVVDLVLREGRIAQVAPQITPPADCAVVDLSGKELTAGLVDPHTDLGLREVDLESETQDPGAHSPSVRVLDSYNPASSLIRVARARGVTSSVILPSGGLIPGQAAWVDLAGSTQAEAVIDSSVAMVVNPGSDLGASLQELRTLFDDARLWAKSPATFEKNRGLPGARDPRELAALQPVLKREIPLLFHVNRASDIEALLRFADETQVRLVIVGGAEAWMFADELAKRSVPVMVDVTLFGPSSFDTLRARPDNAAVLAKAGVPVMISTFSAHNARELTQYAGIAVQQGMDHEAALRAITATPAKVFGLSGYGVIEVGAVANLVAWSGDPLELSTSVDAVWIHGARQDLRTRQTLLLEKYRRIGAPSTKAEPIPAP